MSSSGIEMVDSSQSERELPQQLVEVDVTVAAAYRPGPERLTYMTLAILVMSAECERVFSSAEKLVTPERNRLAEEIIEASECLKNWWDGELIQELEDDTEI